MTKVKKIIIADKIRSSSLDPTWISHPAIVEIGDRVLQTSPMEYGATVGDHEPAIITRSGSMYVEKGHFKDICIVDSIYNAEIGKPAAVMENIGLKDYDNERGYEDTLHMGYNTDIIEYAGTIGYGKEAIPFAATKDILYIEAPGVEIENPMQTNQRIIDNNLKFIQQHEEEIFENPTAQELLSSLRQEIEVSVHQDKGEQEINNINEPEIQNEEIAIGDE